MKRAGMILGLAGSVIGLALSIMVLAAGASLASDLPGLSNAFVVVGVIDIVVCAIAIVGASITPRAPIAGAVMMMVVGAVGFVLFSPLFWIASFVLLVTGGVLAIVGRNQKPSSLQVARVPQVFVVQPMLVQPMVQQPMEQPRVAPRQDQQYAAIPKGVGWGVTSSALAARPEAPETVLAFGAGPAGASRVPETTVGLGAPSRGPEPTAGVTAVPDRIRAAFVQATATTDKRVPTGPGFVPAVSVGQADASAFKGILPFRLSLIGGSGRGGDSWTLPTGRDVHVGRDEACFIALNDGKVSRRHALLSHKPDGLYVTDLGSGNGTRVNEERLGTEARKLVVGDKVRFGDTSLEVGG